MTGRLRRTEPVFGNSEADEKKRSKTNHRRRDFRFKGRDEMFISRLYLMVQRGYLSMLHFPLIGPFKPSTW